MKYYSQNYQDYWVYTELNNYKNGYFIDIGAANGIFISNTYFLEKNLNWNGICVEPNKYLLQDLHTNRTCIIDDSVIGSDGQIVQYIGYDSNMHTQMYSYTSNVILDKYDSCLTNVSKYIETKTSISINSLLEKHKSPEIIHYLSVDINNNDIEVLKNFFLTNKTRKILLITVEHNDEMQANELNEFLSDYNYIPDIEHFQDNNYKLKDFKKYI
jgi:FkbM family methyltransferase